MNYHILSIFLVFIASATGCVIASVKRPHQDGCGYQLVKMFSAGVILSLALVHIIFEAAEELMDVVEYPLGNACALGGMILLLVLEHLSHGWTSRDHDTHECLVHHEDEEHGGRHTHTCINNRNAIIEESSHSYRRSSVIMAYMFEFACVFHSLFIGLSLGITKDAEAVKKMMAALIFHQMLEGISLACILHNTSMTMFKKIFMMVTYSATTPLGILVGKVLGDAQLHGRTQTMVTGCFQGISGGMLLYVALFQIIAEEMSKKEIHKVEKKWVKYGLYVALIAGAASMCGLAVWM